MWGFFWGAYWGIGAILGHCWAILASVRGIFGHSAATLGNLEGSGNRIESLFGHVWSIFLNESEKDHGNHDWCSVRSSVSGARWRPPGHVTRILGPFLVFFGYSRPELGHAPRADTKDRRGTKEVSRQSRKGFAALRPQGAIRCGRAPRRREGQMEGT